MHQEQARSVQVQHVSRVFVWYLLSVFFDWSLAHVHTCEPNFRTYFLMRFTDYAPQASPPQSLRPCIFLGHDDEQIFLYCFRLRNKDKCKILLILFSKQEQLRPSFMLSAIPLMATGENNCNNNCYSLIDSVCWLQQHWDNNFSDQWLLFCKWAYLDATTVTEKQSASRFGDTLAFCCFFFNLSLTFLFSRISLLLFLSLFARCESIQPFSLIHLGCIGPMSEEKGEQLEQIKAQKISRSSGRILDVRPVPGPKDRHRPHRGTAAGSE